MPREREVDGPGDAERVESRTRMLGVAVTASEMEAIRELARERGLTVSKLLRDLALRALVEGEGASCRSTVSGG